MSNHIFADGVKDMQVTNGNVRFTLVQRGAGDREVIDVCKIIIPANRAREVVAALQKGLTDMADQIRKTRDERDQAGEGAAAN